MDQVAALAGIGFFILGFGLFVDARSGFMIVAIEMRERLERKFGLRRNIPTLWRSSAEIAHVEAGVARAGTGLALLGLALMALGVALRFA